METIVKHDSTNVINKDKLWSKSYVLMMVINLFLSIIFFGQNTTLVLYTEHIGGTSVTAGLAMTFVTLAALLFRQVFGYFADAKGRRPVLLFGIVMMSVSAFFFGVISSIHGLLIFSFFRGVGFGATSTASSTIISDLVPRSRLSEGIGYYGVAGTLAMAVGPALILSVVDNISYFAFFAGCTVLGALCLCIVCFLNYEKLRKTETFEQAGMKEPNSSAKKGAFFEKSAVRPAIIGMLILLANSCINIFIPAYAAERGIKNISIFFTAYACALLASRLLTGRLSDKIGSVKVIMPGILIVITAHILLSTAKILPVFILGGILAGLGTGTVQPILNAITIKLCPPDKKGAANATYFSACDFGMMIGSSL